MINKKNIFFFVLIVAVLTPFWMWLAWFCTPKKKLVAAIVDKTVLNQAGQEHVSITWLLNHNRFSKTRSKLYHPAKDYFGFFPLDSQQYLLKGLERYSDSQLESLSEDADMVYFTDTYGIYKNEWYVDKGSTERSGIIYGGLSRQDVQFLGLMKNKHKLILTEFNTIGSPTAEQNRNAFEKMFGMRWTGWTARYFTSFDTLSNKEIPRWLIHNYQREHSGQWPFRRAGIAFVSSSDRVVILEEGTHLTDPMSYIQSNETGKKDLDLPDIINYPFWFDVIVPDTAVNTIAASFLIRTNNKGSAELRQNGLPATIPAVIYHRGRDYTFYYFSGDFCDNPISMSSSYFRGITLFKEFFSTSENPEDRSGFFWKFYRPMLQRILLNYYQGEVNQAGSLANK